VNQLVDAPIAKIRGEPLLEVPRDLYIPPDALEVFLETFEGPLDLLLYLIRKHALDILDIPMAELTRQYLVYIEMMRAQQLELAAEYLVMAAVLIDIKARTLLPRAPESVPEADPRAELMRRLVEYERIKLAAAQLDRLPQAQRDFVTLCIWSDPGTSERWPMVAPEDLRLAWMAVLARARVNQHHKVAREELSLRERMTQVLRRLGATAYLEFGELFDAAAGVAEVVITFLAILELAKENLLILTQAVPFAPIYLARGGSAEPVPGSSAQ
jgi:segregation and condensation protein A